LLVNPLGKNETIGPGAHPPATPVMPFGRPPQVEGGHTETLYKARLGVRTALHCSRRVRK
jgi:hypothetical protein